MSDVSVAGVEVRAEEMKRALDHLTEVAVPMGTRVHVYDDALEFSFHDPEQGWWAITTCRGSALTEPSSADAAAVTVPRLLLREAVEFAQLDPIAQCAVVVHEGESAHVGATAVAASQEWPEIMAPPSVAQRVPAETALPVPAGPWEPEEKVRFVVGGVRLTVMSGLLERFWAREIRHVSLYLGDNAILVGETDDEKPDDQLTLIVPVNVDA